MKFGFVVSMLALALAVGIPGASLAGPNLGDSDGDGVDDLFDNCRDTTNVGQSDFDSDGCGDTCDADYNQDATVGTPDFLTFRGEFGQPQGASIADHNNDLTVGTPDFLTFRGLFGGVPGPSLRPNRDPVACP